MDIGVLPIELLSFDASCKDDMININWLPATEINNDFFTLERSPDGFSWTNVAKLKGGGTATS